MNSFIEIVNTHAKSVAISFIKNAQPTYDIYGDPLPQVERIVHYAKESFGYFLYLHEHDSGALGRHAIVMLATGATGIFAFASFLSAVSSLFAAVISPPCLITCSFSLILSAGSGFICLQLLKDLDANVRYEAVKRGFREIATGRN